MSDHDTWQQYRERERQRIAAEVSAIEAVVNAHWATRWLYRLIHLASRLRPRRR